MAHPVCEVFDEVKKSGLSPVDIVKNEHQRLIARQCLEECPHGNQAVLRTARHLCETYHLCYPVSNNLSFGLIAERVEELRACIFGRVGVDRVRPPH